MSDLMPRCLNCGHSASYHGNPICGYDIGSRRYCQCNEWIGVVYEIEMANARITELIEDRDRLAQAIGEALATANRNNRLRN